MVSYSYACEYPPTQTVDPIWSVTIYRDTHILLINRYLRRCDIPMRLLSMQCPATYNIS